jgi:hypothetical protein
MDTMVGINRMVCIIIAALLKAIHLSWSFSKALLSKVINRVGFIPARRYSTFLVPLGLCTRFQSTYTGSVERLDSLGMIIPD